MSITIGIDIGGSSVEAVARSVDGAEILGRHQVRSTIDGGPSVVTAAVQAVRALGVEDVVGVGIGVPGHVDRDSGEVRLAVNLGIGTGGFGLADAVAAEIDLPVAVENDVRAAVIGARESLRLGGQPVDNLALVSIGTGISAGVVADGALVRGATGMAGEIGHVVVNEDGPLCPCGQRGCLETMSAGPAIGRAWPKGDSGVAATALFAAVLEGDPAARRVADRVTSHLATALVWLAATYDPELIVLAGGVPSSGAVFLDVIREQITHQAAGSELAARRLRPDQLVLADISDPPGPRGAALIAVDDLLRERVSLPAAKKANNQ